MPIDLHALDADRSGSLSDTRSQRLPLNPIRPTRSHSLPVQLSCFGPLRPDHLIRDMNFDWLGGATDRRSTSSIGLLCPRGSCNHRSMDSI